MTPCMDLCKTKIQYYGIINKVKLIILVRRDLKNKEIIGDIWYPTESMRTLNYFLADDSKHKLILHQLYCIGAFPQANVKHIVFVKLDIRYRE